MVMSYIHNDSPAEAVRTVQIVRKIFSNEPKEAENFCRQLFSQLMVYLNNPEDLRIQFLSLSDVHQMFDFFNDLIGNIKDSEDNSKDIISTAIEYINEHYSENITLAEVSNYVALSPGYFSSLFKQNTDEKFIDYLSKIRIEKARDLLINSNIKITAIANLVGYKDAQYFHRVFKLYTGTTPSKYRYDNGKE